MTYEVWRQHIIRPSFQKANTSLNRLACVWYSTTLAHTPELAVEFTVGLDMNTNTRSLVTIQCVLESIQQKVLREGAYGGADNTFTIWGGSGFNISYITKEITFPPSLILNVPFFIRTTIFF